MARFFAVVAFVFVVGVGAPRLANAEPTEFAEPLDLFVEFRKIADRFQKAAKGPADPAYARAVTERDAALTRLATRGEASASPNRAVLSNIYMTLGRHDDAIRTLELVLAAPTGTATLYFRSRLVDALLAVDRVDDAVAALRVSITTPIASTSIEKYLLHLPRPLSRVVEILQAAGRTKEADELLSLAEAQWKAVESLIGTLSREARAPLSTKALVDTLQSLRRAGTSSPAAPAAPAAPSTPPKAPAASPAAPPTPPVAPAAAPESGIAGEHAAILRAYEESGRGPGASEGESIRDAASTRLLAKAEGSKDPDHRTMAAAYRTLRRPVEVARHLTAIVAGDPAALTPRSQLTEALIEAGRLDDAWNTFRETTRIPLDGANGQDGLRSLPVALEHLVDALVAAQRKKEATEAVEAASAQLKTLDPFLATLSAERQRTQFNTGTYMGSIAESRQKAKVQTLFHLTAVDAYLYRFRPSSVSVGREASTEHARTIALRRAVARGLAAEAEAARSTDHYGLLVIYAEADRPTDAIREAEAVLAEKKGRLFGYGQILSAFAALDDIAPALTMFERWLAADVSPDRFVEWRGSTLGGSFHGVHRVIDRLGQLGRAKDAEALLTRMATKVGTVKSQLDAAGKTLSATTSELKDAAKQIEEGRAILDGWTVFHWADSWKSATYAPPVDVAREVLRLKERRRLQSGPRNARPERDRAHAMYEAGIDELLVAAEARPIDRGALFTLYVELARPDDASRHARFWSDERPDDFTRPATASFALERLKRPDDAKALRRRALGAKPAASEVKAYAAAAAVDVKAMVIAAIERKDLAEAGDIVRLFDAQLGALRSRPSEPGAEAKAVSSALDSLTALSGRLARRVTRAGTPGAPPNFRDEFTEVLLAYQAIHPRSPTYGADVKARDAALTRLTTQAEAVKWDGYDVLTAAYVTLGRHEDSLRHAVAWLASAPESLDARRAQIVALVGAKRLDDARAAFAKASEGVPSLANAVQWIRVYPELTSVLVRALFAVKRSSEASEAIETAATRLRTLDTAIAALSPREREALPPTDPFSKSLAEMRKSLEGLDSHLAVDLRKRLIELRKAFLVDPRTIGRDADAGYQAKVAGRRAAAAALAKDAERERSTRHEVLMGIYGTANLATETLREVDAVLAAEKGGFAEHSHIMEALGELSDLGPALAFVGRWIDAEVSWEQFVDWVAPLNLTSSTGLGRIIDRLGDARRDAEAIALLERAASRLARMRARFDAAAVKPANVRVTDFTGREGFREKANRILEEWRTFHFNESSGPVAFASPIDVAAELRRLQTRLAAQSRGTTTGPERERARAVYLDGLTQLAAVAEPSPTQRGLFVILYRELARPADVLRQGKLWVEENPGEIHPPASLALTLDEMGLAAEAKAMRDRALAVEPAAGRVRSYLSNSRTAVGTMIDAAVLRRDYAEADDIIRRLEARLAALRARPTTAEEDAAKLAAAFKLSDEWLAADKKQVMLARRRESLPGTPYRPVTGETWPNGGPSAPDAMKGRVIVLLFWELRPKTLALDALGLWQAEFASNGLSVLGISIRERITVTTLDDKKVALHPASGLTPSQADEEIRKWAKHREIKIPLAAVPDSTFADAYGIDVLPSAVVVDRQGIVRTIVVGWNRRSIDLLRAAIRDALGLKAEPKADDAAPDDTEQR